MDPPPPKRQRTSSPVPVVASARHIHLEPASHEVAPQEAAPLEQAPCENGRRSSKSASFMSPTKSSLVRFYPSLLHQPSPAKPHWSHSNIRPVLNTLSSGGSVVNRTTNGLTSPEDTVELKEVGDVTNGSLNGDGLQFQADKRIGWANPEPTSPNPANPPLPSEGTSPVANQEPRASPPEEARTENVVFQGGEIERQASVEDGPHSKENVTSVNDRVEQPPSTPSHRPRWSRTGMEQSEDGEPLLPSTPTQLGLEPPPERPKGLLFDSESPSANSARKKRKSAKPSPLKPQKSPSKHSISHKSKVCELGHRIYIDGTPQPPPTPEEADWLSLKASLVKLEDKLQEMEADVLQQLLSSKSQWINSKGWKEMPKRRWKVHDIAERIIQLRNETASFRETRRIMPGKGPCIEEMAKREL